MKSVVILFVLAVVALSTAEEAGSSRKHGPGYGACTPYHCGPHGRCVMKGKQKKCKCYSGYTGPYCVRRKCPKNKPAVRCLRNPCMFASCDNQPNARCVSNYCGGCNAVFYVGSKKVKCKSKKSRKCPAPVGIGTCADECSSNKQCKGKRLCCSNGCGKTCMKPIRAYNNF